MKKGVPLYMYLPVFVMNRIPSDLFRIRNPKLDILKNKETGYRFVKTRAGKERAPLEANPDKGSIVISPELAGHKFNQNDEFEGDESDEHESERFETMAGDDGDSGSNHEPMKILTTKEKSKQLQLRPKAIRAFRKKGRLARGGIAIEKLEGLLPATAKKEKSTKASAKEKKSPSPPKEERKMEEYFSSCSGSDNDIGPLLMERMRTAVQVPKEEEEEFYQFYQELQQVPGGITQEDNEEMEGFGLRKLS